MKTYVLKIFALILTVCSVAMSSCSSDDPAPRSENDICGAWRMDTGDYIYFKLPNLCYKVIPETEWGYPQVDYDAYYYEPGYNMLMYVNQESQPDIYQVTALNDREMKWVWADNLLDDKYKDMSKSEILGAIIKEAQEGFKLDYSRTTVFTRISIEEFNDVLRECGYEGGIEDL